ncbi:polymerase [Stenotrophomonas panacihumi]|uniref:Polymerase n=1 Tax=Stenotrophomonas panacihumi TaxID=676599 RepID=A0A0R0A834_9GAMM|nr:polymerase [Stenotrophomonas panacihumi]PTN55512.1 O-antigen ligase family protein [Stenotrophomonas panacihumi]
MTLLHPTRPELPALADASRARRLGGVAEFGVFALAAFVIVMPSGLLPFGLCLFGTSVMGFRAMRQSVPGMGVNLRALGWLTVAVLLMSLWSVLLFEHGLRDVDNRSRFVVLPWAALWVYAMQPRMIWLWRGAVAGIFAALLLAAFQVARGDPRAEGWTNAIVLADIVLMLMVLAVFCRPRGRWIWVVPALVAGCVTIVLSGSRGVWPALLCLLVVVAMGARWRDGRTRLLILAAVAAIGATIVLTVPALTHQMRIGELQRDMQRYEVGDVDSSAGARLERLHVAYDTFLEHPLTGVGVGHFDDAMKRLPICDTDQWIDRCHLGHAHNDVAEWAATQGILGIALLFAVYGVPLWLLVRLYRRSGQTRFRGPAAAGIVVVLSYVLCGMTQSMFAHQVTASFYVSIIGTLIGLAVREAEQAQPLRRG